MCVVRVNRFVHVVVPPIGFPIVEAFRLVRPSLFSNVVGLCTLKVHLLRRALFELKNALYLNLSFFLSFLPIRKKERHHNMISKVSFPSCNKIESYVQKKPMLWLTNHDGDNMVLPLVLG